MSDHLHDESRRKKQVKFRVSEATVEAFDEWVEQSAHESRTAALRQFMEDCPEDDPEPETDGREPPHEDDLREAWLTLLDLRTNDGWVTEERALSALAQQHSYDKKTIRRSIIKPLDKRGYLKQSAGHFGRFRSYKIYE